jgi:hypothetical protein
LFRQEAQRLRAVGCRYPADDALRQRYHDLADEYDRIAELREQQQSA